MINKKQALRIIQKGLETGADYAEIFIEQKTTKSFNIENGKVDTSTVVQINGAGVRLLKNFQSVYGYTNNIDEKSLTELIINLAKSYKEKQCVFVDELKTIKLKKHCKTQISYKNLDVSSVINYLKPADEVLVNYDKRIIRRNIGFVSQYSEITIINSKGKFIKDTRERGRLAISCIAAEGDKIQTGFTGPGTSSGFEFFQNTIDIKELAKDVARQAIVMLGAKECPSGKMPVVIGNGFGGTLFHEACGHPLEASSISKNLSVFNGKIGKQIASKIVSAVDDGTIENAWGSSNIDDEGNPTQKTVLIKNGILMNYLVDDFNGRRMGVNGNGASRRQSYKYEPTSRMSNTFICNGKSTPEEIIKATKFGLYAKSLAGGSVNPITGEFNFGCSEAYLIRDGKICEPVRGASVIGTGQDILMKIDMVGNDLLRAQGICGASSGNIPVDCGQPTIRISEMTVGGNGGEIK